LRVDEALRREIVAAVQKIEQASAAEVVVTIVPRSAAHWDVTLGAALAAILLFQAAAAAFFPDVSALHVAIDSAGLALLVGLVGRALPPLERLLLPGRVKERRVEVGAESAFCRQGIFRTRAHTGILVYLSLLERRAVFLPDEGLARALPSESLAALRAETARLFDAPDAAKALLAFLDHIRRVAARHLPAGLDDVNELPDAPVTG
jgi:putative membrane protein